MSRNLIIIGTSGSALDVLDIVEAINSIRGQWAVKGFLDDVAAPGTTLFGISVLGPVHSAADHSDAVFLNTIGSDRSYQNRPNIVARAGVGVERFTTLVHPGACVSSRVALGRGVYVNYGVSVGGRVKIADHVQLGPGCIVGHDTLIEEHAIIGPGALISGAVHIGPNSYIGAGAKIRQKQKIGRRALVGIGAVVVRDVPAECTVVGCPARILRHHTSSHELDHSNKQPLEAVSH